MDADSQPHDALLAELALARIRQVDRAAAALAADIGFSPPDKYAAIEALGSAALDQPPAADNAANRRTAYSLLVQFVNDAADSGLLEPAVPEAVEQLWPILERTSLRALADYYGHLDLGESDLPNGPVYDTALALLSHISWAVLERDRVGVLPQREHLVEEAESRGLSDELIAPLTTSILDRFRFEQRYPRRPLPPPTP